MWIDIKVLQILFQEIPSGEILKRLRTDLEDNDTLKSRSWFLRHAASVLDGYSEDEYTLIYNHLQKEATDWESAQHRSNIPMSDTLAAEKILPDLAFLCAGKLGETALCIQDQHPRCRIEKTVFWREAFHLLGQDLFVCAFLARADLLAGRKRKNFTWPAVIRTDCKPLNQILDRGLAENHQHLFGSSQSFALSWCDMMNHPADHQLVEKAFEPFRQPIAVRSSRHLLISSSARVRYACFLRMNLFWDLQEAYGSECTFSHLHRWKALSLTDHDAVKNLHLLRLQYGARVPQPKTPPQCLDYALTKDIFQAAPDAPYRILAGERAFLYGCFRLFYEGAMDDSAKWAFYLYLLLKTQFRSEMIQVNRQVGFSNFSIYQDRKATLFGHRGCYNAEHIRMAIKAPFSQEHVTSLETRMKPKSTVRGNIDQVLAVDRLVQHVDNPCHEIRWIGPSDRAVKQRASEDDHFFYVFHFIKRKDSLYKSERMLSTAGNNRCIIRHACRHHKLRKEIRTQALSLARSLSLSVYLSSRVRGIDAASNEIGCPPEIFAVAFRFLRNFRPADYQPKQSFLPLPQPCISATYHVGEDFLDIASALRAIDEAVNFLELQRGDRIGHALGLGVDPKIHYAHKSARIFQYKQDRLDDLVWLLYRGQELGVRIDPHLCRILTKEAEALLTELYHNILRKNCGMVSLTDYYCAMQLRGDDPARYASGCYIEPTGVITQYEEHQVSYIDNARNQYRENELFSNLYYQYHYNEVVKAKGYDICVVDISDDYIALMRQTQEKLQSILEQKGIIVECNPSSNVLIGTFYGYEHHPIFRFNHTGLQMVAEDERNTSQLQVCVNTDDLGVFDTSLEFEYALLYQTLFECKNSDGSRKYSAEEILQYLEYLRNSGHLAVFPRARTQE